MTSQVRLLQGQTVLDDDRKLCEYSIPEGATISALFEPDVDINIDVKTGHQRQKFTVSNATSVMAFKAQISGVMSCGVAPGRLEVRLGDTTLEDLMPLHFYGVRNGSILSILKSYVSVTIENNYGSNLFWRLNRKDTIKQVKVKLAQSSSQMKFDVNYNESGSIHEIRGFQDAGAEGMRLYLITEDQMFS